MARELRRLAAIVFADIVGYSRLMGRDETATLSALRAHQAELIDPAVTEYGGRIVKTMGDGLLLEFASVITATRFAIAVQGGWLTEMREYRPKIKSCSASASTSATSSSKGTTSSATV